MALTRTLLVILMLGVFASSNIIVPIHQLSHVQDEHEATYIDCESFHASATLALLPLSHGYTSPNFKHLHTPLTKEHFKQTKAVRYFQIRAPPVFS